MDIRRRIASDIEAARSDIHDAGVNAPYRRNDPYFCDEEPRAAPVTDACVDEVMGRWSENAASIREYVAKHGAQWREVVRQRWLVRAEELEWLSEQYQTQSANDPQSDPW